MMNAATLAKRAVMTGVGLLLAGGIALGTLALPAYADDGIVPLTTADQTYEFYFENFGDSQSSKPAPKDDATASYILVNNMTIYDVHLYVDGYAGGVWNQNLTRGGYAYLVDPGKWWIHNFVYENGYRTAQLRGLASEAGVLAGMWSPDSWGTYPSLN